MGGSSERHYILGSKKETIFPIVSSVACAGIGVDRAEDTAFQPVLWHAGRWLATAVVSLFVSRSFSSNGSTC
jgi:hypothetical protein